MKILFIWPGMKLPGWNSLHTQKRNEATYISHGYMAMSAVLKREGYDVALLDMRNCLSWVHFETCVATTEYDIAAIGFTSCDADTVSIVCSVLKRIHPDRPIIAGGLHLTATDTREMAYVDTVVHGEGDLALLDLVRSFEAGELPTFLKADIIEDLDKLPLEDRNLFDEEPERRNPLLPGLPAPNVTIITSRGCPYRCAFCSPSGRAVFGSKIRCRSVGRVIEELLTIQNSKGPIGSVMFHSDVLGDEGWIKSFVEAFSRELGYIPFWCQLRADFICKNPELVRELSDIGMYWVSLGAESGSDRVLQFLKKGTTVAQNLEAARILHQNQVNIFCNLIVGLPTETEAEMRETLEMASTIRPAWWSCNSFVSFPGSDLHRYVLENDLITDEHFSEWVYPYQRKIKGLDYAMIAAIQDEIRTYSRPVFPLKKKASSHGIDLSVIMRTWNRPDMLRRAVNSILNQTIHTWQLIIVDDASTNPQVNTVLEDLYDYRIKVIRNQINRDGHCKLINQGIDHADGKYIGFCDDDDTRDPEWAEEMVKFMEAHPEFEVGLCKSKDSVEGIDQISGIRRGEVPPLQDMMQRNFVDLGEMVLRREIFDQIGMFDERLHYGDDWEFASRIMKARIPIGTLDMPLCNHTVHPGGQLNTRTQEQREATKHIIQTKKVKPVFRVAMFWPELDRLQVSQYQVIAGVRDALLRIPHVSLVNEGTSTTAHITEPDTCDMIFVVVPFQCTLTELEGMREYGIPMVAIHTEDPPAFNSNMTNSVYFDWIITNDSSTIPYYTERAMKDSVPYSPERIGHMPCLSVNTAVVGGPPNRNKIDYDMVICGYMYESRREWFEKIAGDVDWKLLLVGRGWEHFGAHFEIMGDQPLAETMALYGRSRIVACIHRLHTDDGTRFAFQTAARGYIEAYSGSAVMIDNSRTFVPPFEEGEVMEYDRDDHRDFIQKTRWLLNNPSEAERMAIKAQDRAVHNFTYIARLTRLIRDLRGWRHNIRVP